MIERALISYGAREGRNVAPIIPIAKGIGFRLRKEETHMSVRRLASLALLAGVALPLVVGCQFLVYKICVKNDTPFYLDELAIKSSGASTYPPSSINPVAPGGNATIKGVKAGGYDIRAEFDVAKSSGGSVCSDVVVIEGLEIENTNVCITYGLLEQEGCDEIYAEIDYVI
jgi:hypothetical protein